MQFCPAHPNLAIRLDHHTAWTRHVPQVVALAAALAIVWPGGQTAVAQNAPVAEWKIDIDGDGAFDTVRIDNPPAVTIVLSRPASSPAAPIWKPFTAALGTPVSGTISAGSGRLSAAAPRSSPRSNLPARSGAAPLPAARCASVRP